MSRLQPLRIDDEQTAEPGRLSRLIGERIDLAGGWIRFDAWMHCALYEPGLGYYSGGRSQFGAGGDFVTAPELSPHYGACVAAQIAQWFDLGAAPVIHEFGAGSGELARQVLQAMPALGWPAVEYRIVEVSASLRERQQSTLAGHIAQTRWLDALPAVIEGVVLANEVLDAMPVRLFRLDGERVLETGVSRDASGHGFRHEDRLADAGFAERVRGVLAASGWAQQGGWPNGYRSEIGEQACAWIRSVGERLGCGAILLIDYGFPVAEFYHPQRSQGTLACHHRHRWHDDALRSPGEQDITAHVDFSAIAAAAASAGLEPLGYSNQAGFLLDCGLVDRLADRARGDARAWASESAAIQTLVSEAEMGELFKVIAFGRGIPDESIGFLRSDRRASLLVERS